MGAPARPGPEPLRTLDGAGQRAVGVPQPAALLHALTGHGVGGLRPRYQGCRAAMAAGSGPEMARAAQQGVRRGNGPRVQRRERVFHPALRHDRGGCLTSPAAQRGIHPRRRPPVPGTVRAVEQELLRDGLVLHYRTDAGLDGLAGDEHPFLACSFGLVTAYAMIGRLEEGHALMRRLVGLANDVGLMSEEYDPINERMAGNFPQAFSHLALIGAANALQNAEKALSEATPSEETVNK